MAGILQCCVGIVTGAGHGLGCEHAIQRARRVAAVVVNNLGTTLDGAGVSVGPAQEVVDPCTLTAATLAVAAEQGAHAADLIALQGRFNEPVVPGDTLDVESWPDGAFELRRDGVSVISNGRAVFA